MVGAEAHLKVRGQRPAPCLAANALAAHPAACPECTSAPSLLVPFSGLTCPALRPCLSPAELVELRNLVTVGELIMSSALQRRESRGGHYCEDFPEAVPQVGRGRVYCLLRLCSGR